MNVLDIIQGQISDDTIIQLSQQTGGTPDQSRAASDGVVSTLISVLSKNAEHPGGFFRRK